MGVAIKKKLWYIVKIATSNMVIYNYLHLRLQMVIIATTSQHCKNHKFDSTTKSCNCG